MFFNNKTLVFVDHFELDKTAQGSLPAASEDKQDKYYSPLVPAGAAGSASGLKNAGRTRVPGRESQAAFHPDSGAWAALVLGGQAPTRGAT